MKGVSRQVIEIKETGSEYFEKMFFVVKPEYSSLSRKKLKRKAVSAAASLSFLPPVKGRKSFPYKTVAGFGAAAGVGAALAAVLIRLV